MKTWMYLGILALSLVAGCGGDASVEGTFSGACSFSKALTPTSNPGTVGSTTCTLEVSGDQAQLTVRYDSSDTDYYRCAGPVTSSGDGAWTVSPTACTAPSGHRCLATTSVDDMLIRTVEEQGHSGVSVRLNIAHENGDYMGACRTYGARHEIEAVFPRP